MQHTVGIDCELRQKKGRKIAYSMSNGGANEIPLLAESLSSVKRPTVHGKRQTIKQVSF